MRGRVFDQHDTPTSRPVAVVNQAFVRKYFEHDDPIGRHFGPGDVTTAGHYEIVGVVEDARYVNPKIPADPMVFVPLLQTIAYTNPLEIAHQNRENTIQSILSEAMLVLLLCGVAAALVPARRAASIDPLTAIRTE